MNAAKTVAKIRCSTKDSIHNIVMFLYGFKYTWVEGVEVSSVTKLFYNFTNDKVKSQELVADTFSS